MTEPKKTPNTIREMLEKLLNEPGIKIIVRNPAWDYLVRYAELRKKQEPNRIWTIRELLNDIVYLHCKRALEEEAQKELGA